jgi:hypothetical protein
VPDEQEVDETPSDSDAEEVAGSGRQQSRDEEERRGLLHESPDLQIEQDSGAGKKKKDKTSIDITGWRLVKNLDFIILFLIMTMVSGTGLLVINVRKYSRRCLLRVLTSLDLHRISAQ